MRIDKIVLDDTSVGIYLDGTLFAQGSYDDHQFLIDSYFLGMCETLDLLEKDYDLYEWEGSWMLMPGNFDDITNKREIE